MSVCPTLETGRLLLRPFRDSDPDSYAAMLQAEAVGSALHLPQSFGRMDAWSQMAAWLGQWELRGTGQWALEGKNDGAFIGRAGLDYPPRADWPGVEVGWVLHPDHWCRGYTTQAGQRVLEYAFVERKLERLCSVILPENVRPIAVARRLGFEFG